MNPEELLKLMKERRSTREYQDKPIPEEAINMILEAGQWCQSASNVQPWRFIVIKKKAILEQIAKLATYGHFIKDAPVAIAIVADKKRAPKWFLYDSSMVSHQICLMAWGLGIGTCWIGSLDRDEAGKILHLDNSEYLTTILPLGYPKGIGKSTRKPLDKIVSVME